MAGKQGEIRFFQTITISMVTQIIHVPLLSILARELWKVNLISLSLGVIVYKT